jgi:hypothetical protein
MFVGLGQVLGRTINSYLNRVMGYTLNIGASLAGVVGFSGLSFRQAPPVVWFFISCAGIAYLLHQVGCLTKLRTAGLIALVLGVGVPIHWFYPMHELRWSPYYMVNHNTEDHYITVNSIGHQKMVPFASAGASYSLIHLL